MKDYWLVINQIDKTIEICFPDNKMNSINACLATISLQDKEKLLEILKQINRNTKEFSLTYEYFTLQISPENIIYELHMFHESVRYFLYTKDLTNALEEYLREYQKLIKI